MNQPQGYSPAVGKVTSVDPCKVIFNPAVPYEVPHMILAAYLVTGFLVASVYAVGMLRGRRDRIHRLGLLIPLTVACIATPIQFVVGDTAARAIANDQPVKFAAMECVQQTPTDVTEYIFGRCTSSGVKGGIGDPRPRLVPRRLEHQHAGHRARLGAARRPPAGQHDAALGVRHDGRDLHAPDRARRLARLRVVAVRDFPQTRWFLRAVAVSGIASIVALECGWIVTEVGRQPWIVYNVMRTSDAVTDASGIWVTFVDVARALRRARVALISCCARCPSAGAARTGRTTACRTGPTRARPGPATGSPG